MSIRDIKAAAAELAAHEAGADSLLCEDCGGHRAMAALASCNIPGEHSLGRYTRAGGAGRVGSGEPTPKAAWTMSTAELIAEVEQSRKTLREGAESIRKGLAVQAEFEEQRAAQVNGRVCSASMPVASDEATIEFVVPRDLLRAVRIGEQWTLVPGVDHG